MSPGQLPLIELERCAQAAHEINRIYCAALGDASQVPWENAPEWQRESAREGALGVLQGNTPEQSHESWSAHKLKDGWKHGPLKNPERKEHPCLVPYSELPEHQRAKDVLFVKTVKSMALALGLEVSE